MRILMLYERHFGRMDEVLARIEAVRHIFLTLVRLMRLRREVAELRAERAELVGVVCDAVDRFRPDDMEPIVQRERLAP